MFYVYGLSNCVYSIKAVQLLELYNLNHKVEWVKPEDKNRYKKQHKMTTFPQIFFKPKGRKLLFKIGGFDNLETAVNIIRLAKSNNIPLCTVEYLYNRIE